MPAGVASAVDIGHSVPAALSLSVSRCAGHTPSVTPRAIPHRMGTSYVVLCHARSVAIRRRRSIFL
eukprot:41237-Eustigmatos_ZCMA.PRE.1